ncbi:hypothetical protein NF867_13105 [Solitalea sp. MAHUQ-68]|uniref:Uncharacterized protein n=1 Tax=Solitalea agri TaxID=2953739 RepID=A0A9X2FBE3_9SPHI|nr:hypothetical protein [Solitalea agri]MCO4293803.1 hypothetical protein [Solitalea agri]
MKKIWGIVLIVAGGVLAIHTLKGLFSFLIMDKSSTYELSRSIGYLIWQLILSGLVFLLIKTGLRSIKE